MQPEPLRAPPPREPIFNLPPVVIALVALILGVHLLASYLDERASLEIVFHWGFVPGAWTVWRSPESLNDILQGLMAGGDMRGAALARVALLDAPSSVWSPLTYAVLHGSWSHVVLNALWLAAFGTPVARRLGAARFLALCVATALGGALAHWLTHAHDFAPMVGASAVVSGMMGAAAWFAFSASPRGGLVDAYAHLRPRETFAQMLRNKRTMTFFGIWFALNFLFGVGAGPLGISDGGVAWEAHIGGFVLGLALFPLLDASPPRPAPRRPFFDGA